MIFLNLTEHSWEIREQNLKFPLVLKIPTTKKY